MSKYDALDQMILGRLGDEPKQFSDIYFGRPRSGDKGVYLACCDLCTANDVPARVLDRRLQELRKKGLIVFSKGWRKALGQQPL
ncbi:MAG: hypothetical protein E6Z83_21805 [Pantoea sp.]|uniref:hypothetical protein n=1 Tax=Pantoea sp. TaxID=69393 RepID=UPI00290F3107|nr:hypothetical protein [Pantoea sp.]MDU5783405.1 hypothetical protein [Pantoea sp.]